MTKKTIRVFRVIKDATLPLFVLMDDKEKVIKSGPGPKALITYGLDNGADEVCHDYNLIAFEEGQRR